MAIIYVRELDRNQDASIRQGRRHGRTRAYLVKTDSAADRPHAALEATDGSTTVPPYGDAFPGSTVLKVIEKRATFYDDTPGLFLVLVEYGTTTKAQEDAAVSPLDRDPDYSWTYEERTEPYFIDADGKRVVNSAGDPFEVLPVRESGSLIITIARNEATHNAAEADAYSHTTNDDDVVIDGTTYPAGTLKLSPIQAQKITERFIESTGTENTITYYRKTYTIKVRRQTWAELIADVGFNEVVSTKHVSIVRHGKMVDKPWPLDGSGAGLAAPVIGVTGVLLTFWGYEQKDWTPLGLE